jgi:hypothetical protein
VNVFGLLIESGIMKGQERLTLQLPDEHRDPNATDADGRNCIQPMDCKSMVLERRHHKPEQINQSHHQNPNRNKRKIVYDAFGLPREQQEKRNKKMSDEEQHRYRLPPGAHAPNVPETVFNLIPGPNDEVL